jgi:hypothetical protein
MHYLSSVYSVTIPLHVSDLLVTHHQEVRIHISENWYVLYVLVDCWWADSIQAHRRLTKMYNTYQWLHIYIVTSWWWATSKPEIRDWIKWRQILCQTGFITRTYRDARSTKHKTGNWTIPISWPDNINHIHRVYKTIRYILREPLYLNTPSHHVLI